MPPGERRLDCLVTCRRLACTRHELSAATDLLRLATNKTDVRPAAA